MAGMRSDIADEIDLSSMELQCDVYVRAYTSEELQEIVQIAYSHRINLLECPQYDRKVSAYQLYLSVDDVDAFVDDIIFGGIDCLIVYTISGWHSGSDTFFYNIGIRCPKESETVCISEEFDHLPVQIGYGFSTADDVFNFIEAAGGFPTGIEPEQMADIEDIFRGG